MNICMAIKVNKWVSQVAQWKNHLLIQERGVQSLGQEDPLEKEMSMHSSILAWRIPWTEEPGGLRSMELQSDTTEDAHSVDLSCRVISDNQVKKNGLKSCHIS